MPSGITGVGATLRFLVFLSSCSESLTLALSLFPNEEPFSEFVMLVLDIGVMGGVDSGIPTGWEFVAVTLGTVPMVGVEEFVDKLIVGGAWEDCVATDDTEFDLDFVGLAVTLFGVGEANVLIAGPGSLESDGADDPVGVGTGEGCVEPDVPTESDGW